MSVNWRTIDTSTPDGLRELDKIIAEQLGWTEFDEVDWFEESYGNYGPIHDDLEGQQPDSEYRALVPRYSANANDSLVLIDKHLSLPFAFELFQQSVNRLWGAMIYDAFPKDNEAIVRRYTERAETPALAICKAWLAWKDAQPAASDANEGGGE